MNRGRHARPLARPGRGLPGARWSGGFSLIELMFALGVAGTVSAFAIPSLAHALDQYRTLGAVRYISSRLQRARAEAVARGANVAIQFGRAAAPGSTDTQGAKTSFTAYVDGNRNGIASAEIRDGTDREIAAASDLAGFAGVDFGLLPGIAAPDGTPFTTFDPIRLGPSRMVSFTPLGTATAGSLYIVGRGGTQYVVRVYGDTGKTQVLRFDVRSKLWRQQ